MPLPRLLSPHCTFPYTCCTCHCDLLLLLAPGRSQAAVMLPSLSLLRLPVLPSCSALWRARITSSASRPVICVLYLAHTLYTAQCAGGDTVQCQSVQQCTGDVERIRKCKTAGCMWMKRACIAAYKAGAPALLTTDMLVLLQTMAIVHVVAQPTSKTCVNTTALLFLPKRAHPPALPASSTALYLVMAYTQPRPMQTADCEAPQKQMRRQQTMHTKLMQHTCVAGVIACSQQSRTVANLPCHALGGRAERYSCNSNAGGLLSACLMAATTR
jgi:hypothetical protein